MFRNIILSFIFVLNSFWLLAQVGSNSWIKYNQYYYKIPVVETGVYRISYNSLLNAGVPLQSINHPRNMQIFGRGEQLHIYVNNELSGTFGVNDYIEFYAEKNDGWYDSALYVSPDHQPNTAYSLFTDTAFYYFTWNNLLTNNRATVSTDVNYSAYTASNYFTYDARQYFNYEYIDGVKINVNSDYVPDPSYADGEGFYDYVISLGTSRTRSLTTKNAYANGPLAQVYFEVMSNSYFVNGSQADHHLLAQVAGLTFDSIYTGYQRLIFHQAVNTSALSSTNTDFVFSSVNDLGSGADRFAVPYLRIVYPHTPDLEGRNEFFMLINDASNQTKSYFNFSNFNGGTNPTLWDIDQHLRIKVTKNGTNYQALIPNGGGVKRCYLGAESKIKNVTSLKKVTPSGKFTNYLNQNPNADYIIITHPSLMGSGGAYATATDYAAYRNTMGSNTLLVNIEELYDQFSYGIHKNPMAIRNFVKALGVIYGYDQFEGLFIIGKAYRARDYRKNSTLFAGTLVPTMGNPPSDVQLISGLIDTLFQPAIPIGRLSAMNLDHVDLYLEKIMLHEDRNQFPYDQWMKRILHFSGGSTSFEQSLFSIFLNNYADIASDTSFGAEVYTFYKTTSDPIQINLSEKIKEYVNHGVSLMTFFGHAAGIGFDISIDNPEEYDNYGKYPVLVANSCFAGDIFQYTGTSSANSSEEFVLIRDKGMIAYIASVTPAYPSLLNTYSSQFYQGFSSRYYGESVGKIIQQSIKDIQFPSAGIKELCLEMTLHGDPLLHINAAPKPDFSIEAQNVFYTPSLVSTAVDSFDFNFVINNVGMAVRDSLLIDVKRSYPNKDSVDLYSYMIPAPYFRDTISIKMPVDRSYGIGNNDIVVTIDGYNLINELSESNNNLVISLNIKAADLTPVYPPEFAIVPSATITLKASTYYPFSTINDYVFELDTTDHFNSPAKLSYQFQSSGGVLSWTPPIVLQDSMVYYWRVSLDSNAQHDYNWRNSSFRYVNSQQGWSQSHFLQFKNNEYQLTKYIEDQRTFAFVNDIKQIIAQTGTYPLVPGTEIYLRLNNSIFGAWSCIPFNVGGMKYYIFNPVSAELLWSNSYGWSFGQFGNIHCTGYNFPCIEFPTGTSDLNPFGIPSVIQDTTWFRRAATFLGQIPDGSMVLAMSYCDAHPQSWPEYLYKAFDTIGSAYIRNIPNATPFIIYGQKGSMGGAHEVISTNPSTLLQMKDSIITNWNEGLIKSPMIGPSRKWSSLHWKQHTLDDMSKGSVDSVCLQLIGYKADGTSQVIIDGIPPDSSDIYSLNDRMDAAVYPYCKLVCYMRDDSARTPAYLDEWSIIYQSVPEAAIDPISLFNFYADTVLQGDSVRLNIAYRNLSNSNFDSLLVRTWVKTNSGEIIPLNERRISPLLANSVLNDTIELATMNLLGQCFLYLEINPINNITGVYDQLEITHSNNTGDIPFFVERDLENPLLEVTFDGIHILNGDIVSARPEITIGLRDENKFKAINDTSLFKVRIKKSEMINYTDVYFKDANLLEFIPANLPDNSAQVVYRPQLEDGEYELLVYANDASSNKSGENGYKIDFVIINKSTITNMLNWPNPFTDKTHFVFTLTGSSVPDYLKIQVLTVSGKLVREIDMNELGPLHIGRNITEYAWDGRDEYGDLLANGVYLYRVVTRLNGESIEHRESGADQYFKKSFGKMYLMR